VARLITAVANCWNFVDRRVVTCASDEPTALQGDRLEVEIPRLQSHDPIGDRLKITAGPDGGRVLEEPGCKANFADCRESHAERGVMVSRPSAAFASRPQGPVVLKAGRLGIFPGSLPTKRLGNFPGGGSSPYHAIPGEDFVADDKRPLRFGMATYPLGV